MGYLAAGLPAYLLGVFPSAYIFSRIFKGVDIRKVGSGNVGGMNTVKEAGLLPGLLTIVFDVGKGILAVYLASRISANPALPLLATFLVVLGHNFNPFLQFRGGKGLATTLGALLVLSPMTAAILLALAALFSLILRDTNTGAGAAAALMPLVYWFLYHHWGWVLLGAATALVIVIKHIPDFRSYRKGRRKLF
ncbi:MAG TPA: glycerol-3-phosphate acyltransferase [Bacillota bacterium]|nr:glycerol-3-phosphate acyltransferase [Bacillota bacterium]